MNIGAPELLIVLTIVLLLVAPVVVTVVALVRAASIPAATWDAAGRSKGIWLTLLAVGVLASWGGVVVVAVWAAAVWPGLRAVQDPPGAIPPGPGATTHGLGAS